jgi:hypothetical protein
MTTAEPLSAGLITIWVLFLSSFRALFSAIDKLWFVDACGVYSLREASLNMIMASRMVGAMGLQDDLFLNFWWSNGPETSGLSDSWVLRNDNKGSGSSVSFLEKNSFLFSCRWKWSKSWRRRCTSGSPGVGQKFRPFDKILIMVSDRGVEDRFTTGLRGVVSSEELLLWLEARRGELLLVGKNVGVMG